MKKLLVLISAIFLIGNMQACSAQDNNTTAMKPDQLKLAVVNVQQVLQQSPKVAELSKKLESQFKDRQQKIGDEQKALQDELDNFKKESPTMSQKDRDAMQKKISNDRADLVKQVVSYQQDLNKEQGKVMQGIIGDLNGIVGSIAKKSGYSLVLDSQAVVYASDGTDITPDVAKQFNSK